MHSFCSICHENFTTTADIVIIKHANDNSLDVSRKRGHYFHRLCLSQWKDCCYMQEDKDFCCPLDRDKVFRMYSIPSYEIAGFDLRDYDHDYASVTCKLKITDKFLDQLKHIDEPDKNDRTLTFYACRFGNYGLVLKLIKRKADFNRPCGKAGFTPLMVAVCHNHHRIVAKLLSTKYIRQDIGVYDKYGKTAFSFACENGYSAIISEFLDRKLVSEHQARYCLEINRSMYRKYPLYGKEIVEKLCYYLNHYHALCGVGTRDDKRK